MGLEVKGDNCGSLDNIILLPIIYYLSFIILC